MNLCDADHKAASKMKSTFKRIGAHMHREHTSPTRNKKDEKEDKADKNDNKPVLLGKTRSRSGTVRDTFKDALPKSRSRYNTLNKERENENGNQPVLLSHPRTHYQAINKENKKENLPQLLKTRTRSQTLRKDKDSVELAKANNPPQGILKSRSRSNTLRNSDKAAMNDPNSNAITKPAPAHTKFPTHRSRPSTENTISEPHELKTPKGHQSRTRSDSHHGHGFHLKIPSPIRSLANTMRREKNLPIPPPTTGAPSSACPTKTRFSLESPQRSSSAPPGGPDKNACVRYKYIFACGHSTEEKVPCEDHFPAFCLDLWHCTEKVVKKSERCEDCQIEVDLAMETAKLSLRLKSSSVVGGTSHNEKYKGLTKGDDELEQKTPRDKRIQHLMDSVPSSGLGGSSAYSSNNNLVSSSPYTETVTYNFNPRTSNYIVSSVEGGLSPAPNFRPGFPRSRSRSFTALTQSLRTKKSDLGIHSTTARTTTMQTAVSMFSSENSNFSDDSLLDNVFEQQRRARSRSNTLNSGSNGGVSARAIMTGGVPGIPGSERLGGFHALDMSRSGIGHASSGTHSIPRDFSSDTYRGRNIGGRDLGSSMLYRGELSMESLTGANMYGVPIIMQTAGSETGRSISQPNGANYGTYDPQEGNPVGSIYTGRKESGTSNYSFAAHVVRQQARSRLETVDTNATLGNGAVIERPLPDPSAYASIGNFYVMSSPSVGQNTPARPLHSPLRAAIGGGRSRSATIFKPQDDDNFFAEGKEPTLPAFPQPTAASGGRSRSATVSRPQADDVFTNRKGSRHDLPGPYPSDPSIRYSVARNTVTVTRSATIASQVPVLSQIYDEDGVFIMSSPPGPATKKIVEEANEEDAERQSMAESLDKALPPIPVENDDANEAPSVDMPDAAVDRKVPRSTTGLYGPLAYNFGSQFLAATGTTGGIVNCDTSSVNDNGLLLSRSQSLNHGSSKNVVAQPLDIHAITTRTSLPGVHAMDKLLVASMEAYEHLPAALWDFHLPGNAVERNDYNRSLPVPGDTGSRGNSRRGSTCSKETLHGDDDGNDMDSSFNEEGIIDAYNERSSPVKGEQNDQQKQRRNCLKRDAFVNLDSSTMNDNSSNSQHQQGQKEKSVFGPVTPPGLRAKLNTKRYNHSQPSEAGPLPLRPTHFHPHQPPKPTDSGDFSWFNLNAAPPSGVVPPNFGHARYGHAGFGEGGFGGDTTPGHTLFTLPGGLTFSNNRVGFASFDGRKPSPEFLKAHYARKAAERAAAGEKEQKKGSNKARGPVAIPPKEESRYREEGWHELMIGIAL